MVKIKILGILLLLALACMPLDTLQEPSLALAEEFNAHTDGFDTDAKTTLKGKLVIWSSGDQLAIFQGTSIADKYQVKEECDGLTMGTFEMLDKGLGTNTPEYNSNVAIYPYQEDIY